MGRFAKSVTFVLLLPGLCGILLAQPERRVEPGAMAEIRIGLPGDAVVSVDPGTDLVLLDLPRGSSFPADFAASSGGLLAQGKVEHDEDRVRVELELALGVLSRVSFEPDAVVLHFQSRFQPQQQTNGVEEEYRMGPDDKLLITVHNQPDLSGSRVITREGLITAPLVGDVLAAGRTPRELAARLAEKLGRTYLVNPRVDVEVEEYRSQWVIVGGQVLRPGRIALRGGTRLKEVLGDAEGFTSDAGEEISITRKLSNGEAKILRVSRGDFESGRSNPTVAHGDIVEVGRADYCYIQGEVRTSHRVRIERGMTLMRVIALAGGLTEWANRKNVMVLYEEGTTPRERFYNLNLIERGEIADPPMNGGELIIVKKRFL